MYFMGPLNVFPFKKKQIYINLKVQNLSGKFWCLKFKVQILKSKIPIQNEYQKTHKQNSNQSVIIKKPNKIQNGRQKFTKT